MDPHYMGIRHGCPAYGGGTGHPCDFRWQTSPHASAEARFYHPPPLYPTRDPLARRIPTLHFGL